MTHRAVLVLCALAGCGGGPPSSSPADAASSDAATADAARGDAATADAATALEYGSFSGIPRVVMSPGYDTDALRADVAEVGPGEAAHAPHTHGGHEVFYVLAGTGELTLDSFTETLAAGEAAMFEGRFLHGIRNASESENLRYMVIRSD